MDRTNLGLAAVAGMNDDLNLIGNRYTIIIMVFFVMYIIFEIPSVWNYSDYTPLLAYHTKTESRAPKSWARQLVSFPRHLLWQYLDWDGFYEIVRDYGTLPCSSWCYRSWLSTR